MRLLSDMFTEKAKRRKVNKIQYRLSFVELRGKEVKDLLLAKTENRIKVNDTDAFKIYRARMHYERRFRFDIVHFAICFYSFEITSG